MFLAEPYSRIFSFYFSLWSFLYLFLFFQLSNAENGFTNEWAVEIEGGDDIANLVATTHGFINHGKVLL